MRKNTTCRAGNVIGGGDFATDRIIPDCVRAAEKGKDIFVRNPTSTRPYQHVLEPLFAYLMIAMEQYSNYSIAGSYNIGPDDCNCVTTGELVDLFCKIWNSSMKPISWICQFDGGPHEANFLKLDSTKLKLTFDWSPRWSVEKSIGKIIEFEEIRLVSGLADRQNDLLANCMKKQIIEYIQDRHEQNTLIQK